MKLVYCPTVSNEEMSAATAAAARAKPRFTPRGTTFTGPGQLLVRGPTVFKEYWRRPADTKKEFTADGWFRTGDCCQMGDEEGALRETIVCAETVERAVGAANDFHREVERERPGGGTSVLSDVYRILGRNSVDIIKSGGYKISALEVEASLLAHPSIAEVAVVAMEDAVFGEKVTAVCVLLGGEQNPKHLDLNSLRAWGKDRMAVYKVPQRLEIVAELPRNAMGKVEKKKLVQLVKDRDSQQQGLCPSGVLVPAGGGS